MSKVTVGEFIAVHNYQSWFLLGPARCYMKLEVHRHIIKKLHKQIVASVQLVQKINDFCLVL